MVPVFARTAPARGRARMRSSSVPLTPATGSAAQNGSRRSTSFQATTSSVASACVSAGRRETGPEPSNMRTPASGTPASARSRSTMRRLRRRPAFAGLGPDLLQDQLCHEVVAVAVHLRQHLRRAARTRPAQAVRAGRCAADSTAPAVIPCRAAAAQLPCRRQRPVAARVAVVPAAVDDERRERRRLVDEERGLPARRRSLRVEPRLVGKHAAVDARDAELASTAPRALRAASDVERRVAVALEEDVAVPDVLLLRADAEQRGRGTGTSCRARRAPRR